MSHSPPDHEEFLAAAHIIDRALAEAIDDAIEANISSTCLAVAVLNHICGVLIDLFEQTPDEVGLLAEKSALAYMAAATAVKH